MLLRQTLSGSSFHHATGHRYKPCVRPAGQRVVSRSCKHQVAPRPTVCRAAEHDAVQWELPSSEQESVQGIYSRMEAAEAAQQQLMASGRLADAVAGGNQLISDLLQAYSTVQKLYHKGFRSFLERHQQLAVAPAGAVPVCLSCNCCSGLVCMGVHQGRLHWLASVGNGLRVCP